MLQNEPVPQESSCLLKKKISTTAYIVTAGQVKLAQLGGWRQYFSQEALFLNSAFMQHARDSYVKYLLSKLPPKLAIWLMDVFFIPGLIQHYISRKRFIEAHVTSAVRSSVSQVINLGAGFDTLALRMAKANPVVQFFEVDLPHTQAVKIQVLKNIEYPVPQNCAFIPADLSQSTLKDVLSPDKGFNPELSTLVILEGVLMYLMEFEVKNLFADLHKLSASPLAIIFGATNTSSAKGNCSMRAINTLLKRGDEGAKWYCPSQSIQQFVEDAGYTLKEAITYKNLQRPYRSKSEISRIPDENENYYIIEKKGV